MGLLDHIKKLAGHPKEENDEDVLARETSKVRAFRTAEEVAEAARALMEKALELRAEIEAMSHE